jgi:hypothetical protein
MFPRLRSLRQGLAAIACLLCLAALSAQGTARSNFVFDGRGNLVVFDEALGSGGWNGEVSEFADPALPSPLSFAVLVTFDCHAELNRLLGSFEFMQADDLGSSIFGLVEGGFTAASESLAGGGQLELDCQGLGGSARYVGVSGFGLSFLSFDPAASGDKNHFEQGLIVAVPEPGMAGLTAFGLLALALALVRTRRPAWKRKSRGAPLLCGGSARLTSWARWPWHPPAWPCPSSLPSSLPSSSARWPWLVRRRRGRRPAPTRRQRR